ncbi:CorA family divalent cation transporter [Lacrimispora sp. JR3]|uniref:CorA family divalent cation transporter n=1 Tax=Lacrimispora sinapis TaxID=3111456 RepID=UPI003748308A
MWKIIFPPYSYGRKEIADLHLSNTSYRLNEIMNVLTIISTIFIPLTFTDGYME